MLIDQLKLKDCVLVSKEVPLSLDDRSLIEKTYKEYTSSFSLSRKNEFLAGRLCAKMASDFLGVKLGELSSVERRPIWPKPIVGSISHTKEYALCCIGRSDIFISIGIDVENIVGPARFNKLSEMICRLEDFDLLAQFGQDKVALAQTILFSAKESLYKMINPLANVFIEFQEAKLNSICFDSHTFVIELISLKVDLASYTGKYQGKFIFDGKKVITVLSLRHS